MPFSVILSAFFVLFYVPYASETFNIPSTTVHPCVQGKIDVYRAHWGGIQAKKKQFLSDRAKVQVSIKVPFPELSRVRFSKSIDWFH